MVHSNLSTGHRLVPAWTISLDKLDNENEKENTEGNGVLSTREGRQQPLLRAQTARRSMSLCSPIMKHRRLSTIESSPKRSPLTIRGAMKTMVTPSPYKLQAWRGSNTEGILLKHERRVSVRTMGSLSVEEEAKTLFHQLEDQSMRRERTSEDPTVELKSVTGDTSGLRRRKSSTKTLVRLLSRGSGKNRMEEGNVEKESTRSSLSSKEEDMLRKRTRESRAKPWQVEKHNIRNKVKKTMIVASVIHPRPPLPLPLRPCLCRDPPTLTSRASLLLSSLCVSLCPHLPARRGSSPRTWRVSETTSTNAERHCWTQTSC